MNKPTNELSLIVPVHNTAQYLDRCVASLLEQTVRDIEVILVDDGSTDGAGVLCDELAACDGRVRVIHQANAGPSAARLVGIRASRGRYLGFVDSDDYVEPDMYERLLAPVRDDARVEVSIGGLMRDELAGGFTYPYHAEKPELWDNGLAAFEEMVRGEKFIWNLADKIYARRLFEKQPTFRYQGIYCEDLYFNSQLVPQANRVAFQPIYGYHYCMNEASLTHQTYREAMLDVIDLWENLLEEFQQRPILQKFFSEKLIEAVLDARHFLLGQGQAGAGIFAEYQLRIYKHLDDALLKPGSERYLDILLKSPTDLTVYRAKKERDIMDFCARGGEQLYIYGAGEYGRRLARLLTSHGVAFAGFVETEKHVESCLGHPVYPLSECTEEDYFLLGLNERNANAVEAILGKRYPHRLRLDLYLACT